LKTPALGFGSEKRKGRVIPQSQSHQYSENDEKINILQLLGFLLNLFHLVAEKLKDDLFPSIRSRPFAPFYPTALESKVEQMTELASWE